MTRKSAEGDNGSQLLDPAVGAAVGAGDTLAWLPQTVNPSLLRAWLAVTQWKVPPAGSRCCANSFVLARMSPDPKSRPVPLNDVAEYCGGEG